MHHYKSDAFSRQFARHVSGKSRQFARHVARLELSVVQTASYLVKSILLKKFSIAEYRL